MSARVGIWFCFGIFTLFLCLIVGDKPYSEEKLFLKFIKKYNRTYKRGSEEYERRFAIFLKNRQVQDKFNSKRPRNESALYGITKFADMSQEEFNAKYLSSYRRSGIAHPLLKSASPGSIISNQMYDIPRSFDWREKSCVTPVRNQKSCGACWAFSIVEAVESKYANRTGKLTMLSVQEVIDCSYHYLNLDACEGGDTCNALQWLQNSNYKLVPESSYPLTDTLGTCKLSPNSTKSGVKVKSHTCNTFIGNEDKLMRAIYLYGPVAVSVDATSWNNYLGGIIQYHCGEVGNNHAVLVVGYDTTGDVPYYIVKNSWGKDFGIDGYLYIAIGNNVCGLADEVSNVEVEVG